MRRRAAARLRWIGAMLVLAALIVGVPVVLVSLAGWPLPGRWPDWDRVTTVLRQGDIPAEVVIKAIAVIVWIAWSQVMWALGWELTVNLPRASHGDRDRRPPLVSSTISQWMGRLVTIVFSVGLATAPSASAAAPSLPAPAAAVPHSVDQLPEPTGGVTDRCEAPRQVASVRPAPRWQVAGRDSLWEIAERALGDGSRVDEILALDGSVKSHRDIHTGQILRLPADATVPPERTPSDGEEHQDRASRHQIVVDSAAPGYLAATVITIQPGDTLWDRSQDRLDTAAGTDVPDAAIVDYVHRVEDANPDVIEDRDLIYPGERFVFPAIGTPPPPSSAESAPNAGPKPTSPEQPPRRSERGENERAKVSKPIPAAPAVPTPTFDLALQHDRVDIAQRAVSQGLRALRVNEPLYRARMQIEARDGNTAGVRNAYNELAQLLDDLAGGADRYKPSGRTRALLEELTGIRD
jgi:nucleoid-associated protein YgaU